MEIIQAKPVPQTASTGSTGASAAAATDSEAGSDGFLSLMNRFTGEGGADDVDAPDSGPGSRPGRAGCVSDPGRHAEPDRSGAFLQPDHPAAAAPVGGRCGGGRGSRAGWIAAATPAGAAAPDPLNALPLPPHHLRLPWGHVPICRPRGLPHSRAKVNRPPMTVRRIRTPSLSSARRTLRSWWPKAKRRSRHGRTGSRSSLRRRQDPSKAPAAPEQATLEQAALKQAGPTAAANGPRCHSCHGCHSCRCQGYLRAGRRHGPGCP